GGKGVTGSEPQQGSRTRFASRPSASSKARKREESDTLPGLEVLGLGMMEDESRHRGLGIHHEALGQSDADLLGLEQVEQDPLIGEVRAGWVAERDPQTTVAGL